jgi:hypothetical protein
MIKLTVDQVPCEHQTGDCIVSAPARQLRHDLAACGSDFRHLNGGDYFKRLERSLIKPKEEVRGSNLSLSLRPADNDGCVERKDASRDLCCGVGVCNGSADSSAGPNGCVCDKRRSLRKCWSKFGYDWTEFQITMASKSANSQPVTRS